MKDLSRAEKLFQENTRLAHWAIRKYYPMFICDEDIQQEALIGLWKACTTYNEEKSVFSTYAVRCIYNAIAHLLRKRSSWGRLKTVSLDECLSDNGELTLAGLVYDPSGDIEDSGVFIEEFIRTLNEKDKAVVSCRLRGLKQIEAAREMGISQAHYSRLLKKVQTKYKSFAYGSGGGRIAQ